MSDDEERSDSGAPIYRHKSRREGIQAPGSQADHLGAIETHLEKYIGKIGMVWHELVSDLVHIDILTIDATDERPWHCLVTSGVSDLPMAVPEGYEKFRRVELMIALPRDWPLTQADFQNEANYWPLRWLKVVGRLPHEYQTWIGWGHTIPNGDPPQPIANTKFAGVMLTPPFQLPPEFFTLKAEDGEEVSFYMITPLYAEELELKLAKGADEVEKRFEEQGIGYVLDSNRPNVAMKRGWFRR